MAKKKESMKNEAVKNAVDKVGVRDPIQSNYTSGQIPLDAAVYTAAEVDALLLSTGSRYVLTTPQVVTSTTTTSNDTISVTISDLSINSITVPSSVAYVNIKFPEKIIGKARDFFIRLTITGSVPEITFKENDNTTPSFDVTDTEWANIGQGVNILAFIETSQS